MKSGPALDPEQLALHNRYMDIAIEEARLGEAEGEQPFGAVVVLDGEIVVRCHSIQVATSDTTAHSETRAISLATQKLRSRHIDRAIFYCTCEPCPMCLGAVLNSGIKTLVMGARNDDVKKLATLAFNFKDYTVEAFADMVGWDLDVVTGVRHEACVDLYRQAPVALSR
jgi:tRNA(adenine34) deaminase